MSRQKDIPVDIYVDKTTGMGSVYDVINLLGGSMDEMIKLPHTILGEFVYLRINGKGAITPVASLDTLLDIIWSPNITQTRFEREKCTRVVKDCLNCPRFGLPPRSRSPVARDAFIHSVTDPSITGNTVGQIGVTTFKRRASTTNTVYPRRLSIVARKNTTFP